MSAVYSAANFAETSKNEFRGRCNLRNRPKESLLRYPLNEGKSQSARKKSGAESLITNYVTALLDAERDWVSIAFALHRTGRSVTHCPLVRSLKLQGLMYKGLLQSAYTALATLMLRTDQFIKRCGKDPAGYPIADYYYHAGNRFNIRYAPDLIGK